MQQNLPPSLSPEAARALLQDPDFQTLARQKTRISLALTVLVMAVYFVFIGLLAWDKDALSAKVAGGATLGIPCGIGVIVLCWILTGLYARWANTRYDELVQRVKDKI